MSVETAVVPALSRSSDPGHTAMPALRKAAVLGAGTMGTRIPSKDARVAPWHRRHWSHSRGTRRQRFTARLMQPAYPWEISTTICLALRLRLGDPGSHGETGDQTGSAGQGAPHLKRNAILITNTSGLPVASIAANRGGMAPRESSRI